VFNYTWTHFIIFMDAMFAIACAATIRAWWRMIRRHAIRSSWHPWAESTGNMVGGFLIFVAYTAFVLFGVTRLADPLHLDRLARTIDMPIRRLEPDRATPAPPPSTPFSSLLPKSRIIGVAQKPRAILRANELRAIVGQSDHDRVVVFEYPLNSPTTEAVCVLTEKRFLVYEGRRGADRFSLLYAYDNVSPEEGLRLFQQDAPSTLKELDYTGSELATPCPPAAAKH
jgi:hypothetical protein